MSERLRFFVTCPPGVEPLLADELRRIGVRGVRPQRSGVQFSDSIARALAVVYWSRLASRVLLTLAEVPASTADELYEHVREIAWEDHVRASGTIAVDAVGTNEALRNTQFTAVRLKDAMVDRFRDRFGRRPSVDVRNPDLRVNVAVRPNKATISLDLAGEPLHRRGYRTAGVQVQAPMKETLAATVLEVAGWREIAAEKGSFIDPMCGSGTLATEAAMIACDFAPGLLRAEHSVARWLAFDAEAWHRIEADAKRRRIIGLRDMPRIVASDVDPRAVEIARRFIERAGLTQQITVELKDLTTLTVPEKSKPGLIATNPPWGERLSERSELPALYRTLASRLREGFGGWRLAVVSPDPNLAHHLGFAIKSVSDFGTAKGAARVTVFDLSKASPLATPAKPSGVPESVASGEGGGSGETDSAVEQLSPIELDPGAGDFANRLGKMAKHYGKWARRSEVSCYRVYDADLPDYAVAVDIYEGAARDEGKRWVHVAEYAAPAGIDQERAARRLDAVAAVVPEVLGVDKEAVFIKRRERQRGTSQYERMARKRALGIVSEAGLLFEVNLSDYLDTGLFLDHRVTRGVVRDLSGGRRFLNLFAYTGSASVYAAAGGATSTTTVDLSATYLDWAGRNMRLNGHEGAQHAFVRDDSLSWLDEAAKAGARYDLVFCDPPTFSNSKRMEGTWDVQRDHVELLASILKVLEPGGEILFSCNRRGFALDESAVEGLGLKFEDISSSTIPRDFERRPGVHKCWRMKLS